MPINEHHTTETGTGLGAEQDHTGAGVIDLPGMGHGASVVNNNVYGQSGVTGNWVAGDFSKGFLKNNYVRRLTTGSLTTDADTKQSDNILN